MRTARADGLSARFSVHRKPSIKGASFISLPNYRQQDDYSCRFLAALTVVHFYDETVPAARVLSHCKVATNVDTGRRQLVKGLRELGISATYRDDLGILDLYRYVKVDVPVIISVMPDGWSSDHWTVVRGFSYNKVWLTNHYSLLLSDFVREWIDNWGDGSVTGAGLVCIPEDI